MSIAQALEALYRDPARRARAAVSVAQNPAYSWDAVTQQFNEFFVGPRGRYEDYEGAQLSCGWI